MSIPSPDLVSIERHSPISTEITARNQELPNNAFVTRHNNKAIELSQNTCSLVPDTLLAPLARIYT